VVTGEQAESGAELSACSMCYGRWRLVLICYHGDKHMVYNRVLNQS